MGKIKTIIMGDEKAEEEARKKTEAKREAKKLLKKAATDITDVTETPDEEKTNQSVKSKKSVKSDKYSFGTGKKYLKVKALVDKNKTYALKEAIELVKKTSYSKFDGTVEVIFNVAEKGLRGTVSLPHGTGKQIRVKIADDELVSTLEKGRIDFDILIAHPSMMPKLAKVAKILGPKGLMPNPKTGTIGEDPEKIAEKLSKGQIQFKTEADFPIIHSIIGKVNFEDKKLEENFMTLVKAIGKDKIKSTFVKPTMGPAIKIAI